MLCDVNRRTREFEYFQFIYLKFFLGEGGRNVDTGSSQEGFPQRVPPARRLGRAILPGSRATTTMPSALTQLCGHILISVDSL